MKKVVGFLLLMLCLKLPVSPAWSAPTGAPAGRIFDSGQVGEACDLAERTGVPLCICVLDLYPLQPQLQGLEAYWKEAMESLSKQCVVLYSDYNNKALKGLADLQLRTKTASTSIRLTGIKLVDPWQEIELARTEINPFEIDEPETRRKILPKFKEQVAKVLQTATDWNVKNGLKPETWTDQANRPLTATATGRDDKAGQFKLSNGKTVTLALSTLSEDSRKRLLNQFPPALPILDSDDAAAFEKHVGQEVIVLSRKPEFRDYRAVETSADGERGGCIFSFISPMAGYRLDQKTAAKLRQSHPDGTFEDFKITRMKGLLQKPTDPKAAYQFYILIEHPRQLGPGIPRS